MRNRWFTDRPYNNYVCMRVCIVHACSGVCWPACTPRCVSPSVAGATGVIPAALSPQPSSSRRNSRRHRPSTTAWTWLRHRRHSARSSQRQHRHTTAPRAHQSPTRETTVGGVTDKLAQSATGRSYGTNTSRTG